MDLWCDSHSAQLYLLLEQDDMANCHASFTASACFSFNKYTNVYRVLIKPVKPGKEKRGDFR